MGTRSHDDQTVIVTGTSSGIGREIALQYGRRGANVVCASPSNEPHQGERYATDATVPTEQIIADETTGEGLFVRTDVTVPDQVSALVTETVKSFGGLDVLVNNAGIYIEGDSQELSLTEWEKQLAVDLDGAFYCAKYAVPHLKDSSGYLVNVSSVNATEGGSGPAYTSAKAGLVNLTRDLAVELGDDEVNVNCISPGYVKTPMQDYLTEEDIRKSREQTLLPRLGEPSDVADMTLFLTSGRADFVHGENIHVDGGWTAHRF